MAKKDKEKKAKKKEKTKSPAMMAIQKDSYIIVRQGTKHHLCLAINPERNRAVIDRTLADEEHQTIEYDEQTLIANLGTNPKPGGNAFGVKINPYISSVDSKYGPMHFFRVLEDLEKKALKSALRRTYEKMLDNNLNIFPLGSLKFFPKRGKYAGCYHIKRSMSEFTDGIDLFPDTFSDRAYNEYVLYHEYAHAVWFRMVPAAYKARWIKLYHKRLELNSILKDRLESMLGELIEFTGTFKEFYKELEDQDSLVFREVLSHYKRYHKLDGRSLEILYIEDSEKFASMWPKRTTIVESRPDLSEYSMMNPDEFFAEAFAFHMTEKHMPKDITKAMEKTLKALQSI